MNSKEKVLLAITVLFALYNLFEITTILFSNNSNNTNGYFNLLLPLLVIANLFWAARKRKRLAYISLALCIISITGAIVMIESVSISPF